MGIIFYGWRTVAMGADDILVSCPSCEGTTTADIMVYSKYFHIFWIPMFPFEKTALTVCAGCGLKKYGIPSIQNPSSTIKLSSRGLSIPFGLILALPS
jgi:hypothetical protein